MLYLFARWVCRCFFTLVYRWKVDGAHHIPADGPVIVCCNHIGNLDPPLVGSALQRKVHFMAKEELFRVPLLGQLIQALGAFPVKRGASDKRAIKQALTLLEQNRVLVIFPEGTRSKTGELGEGRPGAAFLALKSNATVVPAAIIGPYRLFRPIRVRFGPPVDLTPWLETKVSTETTKEATKRIMQEIRRLIEEGSGR
jgi:1-acyl-sn-glycerol-3-phosphate acyltransferase